MIAALALLPLSATPLLARPESQACGFVLGFATLRTLVGADMVGACTETQRTTADPAAALASWGGDDVKWELSSATARQAIDFVRGVVLLAVVVLPAVLLARLSPPEADVVLGPARVYRGGGTTQPPLPERPAPVGGGSLVYPAGGRGSGYVRVIDSLAPPAPTELETALLALLNADREAQGLPAAALDPALLPIARQRAGDQLSLIALSHVDAVGRIAFAGLLAQAEVPYLLAGENLARLAELGETTELAQRAERALMNSPTHRGNILEPRFDRVAVGAQSSGLGRVAIAQVFRKVP